MNYARINDLKVNPAKKLNNMVKKHLVNIVENEFTQQTSIIDAETREKKRRALEQYKKGINFDALLKKYKKAELAVKLATEKEREMLHQIHLKGLEYNGELNVTCYNDDPNEKEAQKKIEKLLDSVVGQTPNNIKNKIISRLWLTDNYAEAMVILREVLGNGMIPSFTVNEIKALPSE